MQGNTALIWFESPTNPLLSVYDIRAVAAVAHAHGALAVRGQHLCDAA